MSRSPPDRRRTPERRHRTLWAILYGSFNPRRRNARRSGGPRIGGLDWHEPRWLAVAILIVLFSTTDAFLTLRLIDHGAYEVNPIMRHLVGSSTVLFAAIKMGLTIVGVVLLTLLARVRAFGGLPVGLLLYAVLAAYGVLLAYEVDLLNAYVPA